jgi:voltage-gated potassium channel
MTLSAQLGLATLVVAATVFVHLVGLASLLAILRRHRHVSNHMLAALINSAVIVLAAFGLFALHSIEIWTWAGVYMLVDALPDLEQALYFSTSTYVTIGYGDLVLPPGLRMLGAIEGASGIILIGWSTAFFFSIVDRLKLLERELESDGPRQPAEATPTNNRKALASRTSE